MNETENATDDERLVARVRAAVAGRIPANGLATYIGRGPLIDTTSGGSLEYLRTVDFAPESRAPRGAQRTMDKARAVVYWGRQVPRE